MAGGNDHLEVVNNVGGERRPGKEKENPHFSKAQMAFSQSALGFGPQGSQNPSLINITSSKAHSVFFYFAMVY